MDWYIISLKMLLADDKAFKEKRISLIDSSFPVSINITEFLFFFNNY